MTYRDANMAIQGYNKRIKCEFEQSAALLSGLAMQIHSAIACNFTKGARFLTLKKLYPKLFEIELAEDERIQREKQIWKYFLRR